MARPGLLADNADGNVLEFCGTVPETPGDDADQATLVAAGVLRRGRVGEQRIAVLAVSHSVICWNPRRQWQALKVRVRAVAPNPTYAMRVSVPREFAVSTDPGKELVRRSLNAAEREEVRRYIRQVWRGSARVLLWLVPYTAIGAMLLLSWIRSPDHRLLGLAAPAVCAFFVVQAVRPLAPLMLRSTLLSHDLASGQVITVRPRPHSEVGVGEVVSPGAPPQEFLPLSGLVWTENGRPAAWRDLVED